MAQVKITLVGIEFHLGLAFLMSISEVMDFNEIGKDPSLVYKEIPLLMFHSRKYACERKGNPVDFTLEDIYDLVDENDGIGGNFWNDFQLAFYNDNVQKIYPNYTSLPPIIIAVSKKEPEYAEPFLLLNDIIEIGRKGGKLRERGEILGYQQCVEHYEYHIQNNNMFNRNLESTGFNILTNVE